MFYRSDRLLLRPIWPEDWEGVYAEIADEGVVRNLASAPWPYTAVDAQKFAAMGSGADPLFPRFLATIADHGAVIGCIGMDPRDDETELGYWIGRRHWGHGYATEAARAVVEIARMLGHKRLIASHFADNPASGNVLCKAGFVRTGETESRFSRARGGQAEGICYMLDLAARPIPHRQAPMAA